MNTTAKPRILSEISTTMAVAASSLGPPIDCESSICDGSPVKAQSGERRESEKGAITRGEQGGSQSRTKERRSHPAT